MNQTFIRLIAHAQHVFMRDSTLPLIGVPLYFTGKRVLPGGVGHDAPPYPPPPWGRGPDPLCIIAYPVPGRGARGPSVGLSAGRASHGRGQYYLVLAVLEVTTLLVACHEKIHLHDLTNSLSKRLRRPSIVLSTALK